MQQNKLQELTDKLYQEGLAKGKKEGEELLAKALEEKKQIIARAKEEAEHIITAAKKTAESTKTTANSETQMAARRTISTIKQSTENLIITKAISDPVTNALTEKEFVQKMILAAIGKFDPDQSGILSLLLPENMEQFAREQIQKQLARTVEVKLDKNNKTGFKIGPKSGGYHIEFTEAAFENLFSESLRPHIRKLLFGENN